ncbi:MAG: hypothetical protein EXS35_14430 [Pedosphaera sp.]|nr:hypothetical protein [Pedosphaera sp.]
MALIRTARFTLLVAAALSFIQVSGVRAAENGAAPFPTGNHLQWVRAFHATNEGLLTPDIRAVTVTRDGAVLAVAGRTLARLTDNRWTEESAPPGVTALFAPINGPEALAGGTNGVWSRTQGEWRLEAGSPAKVIAFAAEPDGTPWALAPSGVWRRADGWKRIHTIRGDVESPRSLLPTGPRDVMLAAESGLFGLMGKRKYWLDFEVRPGGLLSANTRALARFGRDHFLVATDKGLSISTGTTGWKSYTGAEGLPILDLTGAATGTDGTVWLGSDQGLIRWQGGRWSYLAGKRWLPDDRVTAIAPAPDGSVWVGTPLGLSHIYQRSLTLAEKSAIYQKDLESRDRRHGYVTHMHLRAPGVLDGAQQELSDNDGMWTALYIASQSYRYAVTKAPEAKAQAARSMQALLRLESITGIPGFPARAICHTNEPQFHLRSLRSDSEWHASSVEPGWYWKGETSSDELDGHYFAWQVFYDLAANDEEKRQVRATCKRVTDHILDHGLTLVDLDGKPTTWGVWSPEKLNDDPTWWADRGLGSLEILSHLKVAAHIVPDASGRYEQMIQELVRKHHYALNTINAKVPGGISHDDQLMFLSYYPLLQLERDPGLRAIYRASLRRTLEMERIERNPLWSFIFSASTGEPCDVEAAVETLREMPLDFIVWRMKNSQRADLQYSSIPGPRGEKQLLKPLPWTERIVQHWDHSPYEPDGGSDLTEADQTVWLLPYWMGRHHRLID